VELKDIIARYKQITGGEFGRAVGMQEFGLAFEEAERVFSQYDEDYHISRYFHFSDQRSAAREAAFSINGFPHTHVTLDPEVEEIL